MYIQSCILDSILMFFSTRISEDFLANAKILDSNPSEKTG